MFSLPVMRCGMMGMRWLCAVSTSLEGLAWLRRICKLCAVSCVGVGGWGGGELESELMSMMLHRDIWVWIGGGARFGRTGAGSVGVVCCVVVFC